MDVLAPLLKSSSNAEVAQTALRPDRNRYYLHFVWFLLILVCGAIVLVQGQVAADETPKRETNSSGETAMAELDVTELAIDPRQITLQHADDSAQLLVTARLTDGTLRDVTHHVEWIVDQPDVVVIKSGHVNPRGNGHAKLTAQMTHRNSQQIEQIARAAVEVTVLKYEQPRPLSFSNDIVPLLSQSGCNSGGCHGKAIGQNGFKLSLYGYDTTSDYAALVHEGLGRRVSPAAPDDSLILLKATGAMPHGGGIRFSQESEAYNLLKRWIEQGLPFDPSDLPSDVKLVVTPDERIVRGKGQQQIRVTVQYSDGSERDVTRIARYDSQHNEILTVDAQGLVETTGRGGETSVMVRYQNAVAVSRMIVLTEATKPEAAYATFQPKNFVDEFVLAKWRKLHITPSPIASDSEFLRRVFLDAMGTLPTPPEVRAFLADTNPHKRDQLVDQVLERDEFYDLWSHRMADLLRNRVGDASAKENTIKFAEWIRRSLVENKPYDQFVRDILTVTGKRKDHPQMDWYRWAITNENRVEDTAQAFLGMRVSCANCHNHPFEKVSQTDYWRFAAFFSRLKSVTYGSVDELGLDEKGEIKHPRTEQILSPKAFGGPEFEFIAGEDPRQKLAAWITAPENPYFARAICNRIWGHLMGIGFTDPVDDMRTTNPPTNPKLLDALAKDFVEHQFNLKHLMKTILKSRVYSLSSEPNADNRADTRNYARYFSRRLQPHVLLDAICSATGVPQKFDEYPNVKKAILLPNEKARNDFLDIFGRSERTTPCECETSLAPNLPQVLFLLNSEELQRKLTDKSSITGELAKPERSSPEVVEELFLRTFSRLPSTPELLDAVKILDREPDRRVAIEDLLWTFLNSKEFLFNH